MSELQDLILKSVKLGIKTGTGFREIVCKVCKDHRKRAGFMFKEDGTIVYNCFRGKCDASCVFTPGEPMSGKFKHLLYVYGVKLPPEMALELSVTKPAAPAKVLNPVIYEEHHYRTTELPAYFMRYDPKAHWLAREYLAERFIEDMDFYVNTEQDFLYVPLRFYDRLIGYQAIKLGQKFYQRSTENTDLLYFPNGEVPAEPILVEGIIDAKSIPFGVATLQPTVSKKQAYILRNTNPILLPDKEGSRFMQVAKTYGWRVIIPTYKEKDTNKALAKYGRLVLAEILRDNVISNYDTAKMKYELWRTK